MFGHDDSNQTVMGSPTVQNPSMLDNVSTTDFQSTDNATPAPAADPAPSSPMQDMMSASMIGSAAPAAPATSDDSTTTAPPPSEEPATAEHALTTDNPFIQENTPVEEPAPEVAQSDVSESIPQDVMDVVSSPSAPVDPPVVQPSDDDTQEAQSSYVSALSDTTDSHPPIDHDKLADMKREALDHLEPLADHVGGTPEETFKTTMMMIQANDNHTLLEKALAAAKKIEDDKIRAQAMLDIVNEINYFSQQG